MVQNHDLAQRFGLLTSHNYLRQTNFIAWLLQLIGNILVHITDIKRKQNRQCGLTI